MKVLFGSILIVLSSPGWAGPFQIAGYGNTRKIWDLGSVKKALHAPESYSSRVQDFFKKNGEKSRVYEFKNISSYADQTEMKSLVVHDPASGEAVFQVQKKDGGGYQGQMSLGKLENGENVDIQTKEVNGTLQVIADVTRPRTTSSSHNLTSTFRAAPVNGQSMLITTKRILHMDHPTIDPRYYTEKTISVLDDSMKIRVSNLTLHRIPKRSGQYIQSHAIAEIPNPIPNSKVIDVQIDANNKVVISALDQQGTLHTLNYKFVEELNRDLSAAKPSEALTNRARLVVDDSRPGTVVENAIKNGHLKAQVDAIPAPQKVSPTQNVNNINLPPMSVPTATQ